ncbi:glycosyltransferase [Litoribaculum gwangyangense]|uniref:Glycosyltransferase family 4 protein n=1 Tax=Litoribaculum gwangyangense TaxID=1130722 RepID=A0ABP9C0U6_9FLAO
MRLLFFPKYTEKGASSRYRTYQYLHYFNDYEIEVFPFFDNRYTPSQSFKSIKGVFYVAFCYFRRCLNMLRIKRSDLVFLEYEFMPYLPFNTFFFKLFNINYIVDYDDAIFHNYDLHPNRFIRFLLKDKVSKVIKFSKTVITGSPYLTGFAKKYNQNVVEIPTSINLNKYNTNNNPISSKFIIGWIGSKATSYNLLSLISVFESLKAKDLNFEIRCIGFDRELENQFKNLPFFIVDWNSETEVEEISKFSVGIMPLENTAFNKGKCAFKLIQYMACGIPTISTPLPANIKVNRNNFNLFANSKDEWINAFIELNKNPKRFKEIGHLNRIIVENHYSIQSNINLYKNIFKSTYCVF